MRTNLEDSMATIWKQIKATIQNQIPAHCFRMWIDPIAVQETDAEELVLTCPNAFSCRRVQENYGALIQRESLKYGLHHCRFAVGNGHKAEQEDAPAAGLQQMTFQNIALKPAAGRFLHKDFTFDQFVVGRNNDFAYSASLAMASRRKSDQSCLYLMSKTGLGKSHLAQAIGHHIIAEYPEERVYYVTAEDFSNEMVMSFRNDCFEQFKGKYRNQCDVLLLEDVHCLGGKDRTQLELASTLDSLFEAGKKIIFSSCYRPSDIPRLNDKLRSRFSYGLVSAIDPPDFKTRVRILNKKAKGRHITIPRDVAHYLAGELTEDIRQLESGIMQVAAKSSLLGMPIDRQLAEGVVRNIIIARKDITVDVIKKIVCRHYNVTLKDLISRSRKQSIVRPRQMAIFLSRRYTDAPLQAIGKAFNRYHATALHSINAIENGARKSASLRKQVEYLSEKLDQGDF
jgi:chromosomal replication initiator protein